MQSKNAPPAQRRLLLGAILGLLVTVFLLPFVAMAASGSWRAGLIYFLPNMVQTIINVTIEGASQRAGKTLAVYGGPM